MASSVSSKENKYPKPLAGNWRIIDQVWEAPFIHLKCIKENIRKHCSKRILFSLYHFSWNFSLKRGQTLIDGRDSPSSFKATGFIDFVLSFLPSFLPSFLLSLLLSFVLSSIQFIHFNLINKFIHSFIHSSMQCNST